MLCTHPGCDIDHEAIDLEPAADGAAEVAVTEVQAEAGLEHHELEAATSLEHHELEAETAVELAQVHEQAETERAEIAAEAAVDIAEAGAAAEVASAEVIAEVIAGESTDGDEPVDEADELDDEGQVDDELGEGAPAEATPVSVPPQVMDDTPRSSEPRAAGRTTNAFHARRMANRRR